MDRDIQLWEGEGGAVPALRDFTAASTERVRTNREGATDVERRLDAERDETEAVVAFIESKRAGATSQNPDDYFIWAWQEIGHQAGKTRKNLWPVRKPLGECGDVGRR